MVTINYKRNIIRIGHIWFGEEILEKENAKTENNDIEIYYGIKFKNSFLEQYSHVSYQCSLLTDLTKTQENLLKEIEKNYRYEIRRSIREGIEIKNYSSYDLLQEGYILNLYEKTYNAMYRSKKLKIKLNRKLIERYIESKAFCLTVAYCENEPIVFHSYICDNSNARLFHSCSLFRIEKEKSDLIGRANKYLHYADMLYFKKNYFKILDWGGY